MKEALDTAIELTEADFGNVQLLDLVTGTLKIAAQCGLTPEFLEYFDQAHKGEAPAAWH